MIVYKSDSPSLMIGVDFSQPSDTKVVYSVSVWSFTSVYTGGEQRSVMTHVKQFES